ncbi:MAG: lactate utilization protein [Verrucomicrobia bacterium]|nr:MAG: lactate utilization protein [Verrucomicrobiota bacterium]
MDLKKLSDTFRARGFKVDIFDDEHEASKFILAECENLNVGMGGSVTLSETGIADLLLKRGNAHWHFRNGDRGEIRAAAEAEVYISGINAISQTGEIVNIDGVGNRVSAAIYGANRKKVIFVCGINKITDTLEKALWRAKNVASPLNAKRLKRATPYAAKADKCYNCNSPERICKVTAIFTRPTGDNVQTHIVIIKKTLGF